jgi:hypothetical protein
LDGEGNGHQKSEPMMKQELLEHLVSVRQHVGEERFDELACNLRRELTLWLRAATSKLPEADRVNIEIVVQQALAACGLDGSYDVH